jgi:hypothetical protein
MLSKKISQAEPKKLTKRQLDALLKRMSAETSLKSGQKPLTMKEIVEECTIVRKEMYEQGRLGRKYLD